MFGEKNLEILLKSAEPEHNPGEYVFCKVDSFDGINTDKIVMMFKEREAITLIASRESADELGFEYSSIFSWITLTVHSSLDAVGLTAAFATALAKSNISCNVVAGFYHDHIFVGVKDLEQAMVVLRNL